MRPGQFTNRVKSDQQPGGVATLATTVRRCLAHPVDRFHLTDRDPYRFLLWCLYLLRGGTIIALLLVTLMQPVWGRLGNVLEINILLYATYTVLIELIRRQVPALHSLAWMCILDLPGALLTYALGAAPGGLLFVIVFLDVVCAAATLSLRGNLLYTAFVSGSLVVIDPTFPLWNADVGDVQRLSGRLLILALTAFGTAALTQRLRLEQARTQESRTEAERLMELNQLRSELVIMLSHDLRTPLTGARAGTSMLEASIYDRLRPDEQELIGSTRRNIQRLGWLIDDLLTLNQLDANALTLNCTPLDLRGVVTEVIPMFHSLLLDKQQTLEVDLPHPLPIEGDPQRLEQVIINLIANAHRHTPRGTRITIAGQTMETQVHLSVSDTGPGVPAEEQEAIFQRFYHRGPGRGSSGLGLAIVKGIVELHKGRVWVESKPGLNTTFHIVLPRHEGGEQG